jgi:rhodanese-related sulfurtransferase
MINFLRKVLGLRAKTPIDLANALVVDVRTPSEFAGGNVPGSINISLQSLGNQLAKLPKDKKIVTVCASGMRSAAAASQLKAAGFEAVNGGSWRSLA